MACMLKGATPLVGVKACVVTVSVPDAGADGAVTVTVALAEALPAALETLSTIG